MFTGIITDIGVIKSVEDRGDVRMVIECGAFDLSRTEVGASIACSGACMTVVEKGDDWFAIDVSAESLSKTTLKDWKAGTKVNLEASLRLGDELGGHIVSGHVDGLARLMEIKEEGGSHRLVFAVPEEFAGYIAQKGSVALDGASLTVNEVAGHQFGVNIIPHTWEVTTFGDLKAGDQVNFEVDMLARYVSRQMENLRLSGCK